MGKFGDEQGFASPYPDEEANAQSPNYFLARISHELRTPLTMIIGQSDALQEGLYGSLNEEQLAAVEQVTQSGVHLLKLIDSILDYNQFSAGILRFNPAKVPIEPILHGALHLVEHHAAEKNIQIHVEDKTNNISIEADETQVIQILVNLLDNAVKFTEPNGSIWMSASTVAENELPTSQASSNSIRLTVEDTGVGIDPEEFNLIFEPFVQGATNNDAKRSGFGLGLSIIQQMVELHNGSVKIESRPGHGSRFIVTLPIHHMPTEKTADSASDRDRQSLQLSRK